jgi:hypothetical protein
VETLGITFVVVNADESHLQENSIESTNANRTIFDFRKEKF